MTLLTRLTRLLSDESGQIKIGQTNPWYGNQNFQQDLLDKQDPHAVPQNSGYEWDPVVGNYTRTPASAGTRAGTYVSSLDQAAGIPSISGLMSGIGGTGGTGSSSSTGSGGGFGGGAGSTNGAGTSASGSGTYVAPISMPDPTKATNAAFATAKDQAGNTARASLDSLNNELASEGLMGSGAQAAGTRDIISQGQGELGAAGRQEAVTNAQTAADFAKTGYQGAIEQRGQDVQAQEAQARLAFEQTQAAYQRNIQLLGLALGGLNSAGAGGGTAYGPGSNPYAFGG